MKETTSQADPSSSQPHRRLGYWAGHLAVVGSMIGVGILTTSGFILHSSGNPIAMLCLWLVGGGLAVCGAVTAAELATAVPRSGGDYVFVREAFGPEAGFVSGWATFLLGFAAPAALIATQCVKYLAGPTLPTVIEQFPGLAGVPVVPIGATALVAAVGTMHALGYRHSSRLQFLTTGITAAVLVSLSVGGIVFGRGDWNHLEASSWPDGGQALTLLAGLIYVNYAYCGWNAAAYLAGEIKNPSRTLPRCLIGGTLTVTALYLIVNLAYVYALNPMTIAAMPIDSVDQVAMLAAKALFGSVAAGVTGVALGLSLSGSVTASLLTGPRVAFAMARDGVFPGYAAHLHPTRGTPTRAIATLAAVTIGLIWSGTFEQLLSYTAVGVAALSGLTVASVFPLRRRPGHTLAFRMPLYPLPPLAYLTVIGWTIGYTLFDPDHPERRGPAVLSLATLLVAIPLSKFLLPRTKHSPEA